MDSILNSVKKSLGIDSEYTHFDPDIILGINSTFMNLNQFGVGPEAGFSISGSEETWSLFLGEATNLEAVKSYMYLKVRLLFDPPSTSFVIEAMERMIQEYEWRITVQAEPVIEATERLIQEYNSKVEPVSESTE